MQGQHLDAATRSHLKVGEYFFSAVVPAKARIQPRKYSGKMDSGFRRNDWDR